MVEILSIIREVFGSDLSHPWIVEALSYPDNQRIALLGNYALDLCNSLILYDGDFFSRQLRFSRENHRNIVNSDRAFVNYLIENDYLENIQKAIGKKRADNYLEGIVGAIYLTQGIEGVAKFMSHVYLIIPEDEVNE